jgi:CIC family chloride channel protein
LLLLPALWVCTIAFMLSDRQSIYSQQVESRTRSPAHQGAYVRQALAGVTVASMLRKDNLRLQPGDSMASVFRRFDNATITVMPVVDADDRLLGVIDLEEVYLVSHEPSVQPLLLATDLMRSDVTPVLAEESIETVYASFVESELSALPVVNDLRERRVIGSIRRSDVASAYLRLLYGTSPPAQDS